MTKIDWLNPLLDYNNVLIRPKCSSLTTRSEVELCRTIPFMRDGTSAQRWNGLPIIAANMDSTGTFEVYNVLSKYNMITAMNKFYTVEDYLQAGDLDPDLFMVSIGISNGELLNLKKIMEAIPCNWICIDIANGYIKPFMDFCKLVRSYYPDKIIVAGNVATEEIVKDLIVDGGVDVVKIGIGPGSACTTRLKTGVGVPQLSAVMKCAEAAHNAGGYIIADGGITCPGDVSKAFGAGADFVMIGGQFAGCDETPGEIIEKDGKLYKKFHGMSSKKAMETHYGKMNKYRAAEGREMLIPYKGALCDTVDDYLGGLRSTCTYIGSKTIQDMPECTTFGLVKQQLNTSLANN